MIFIFDLITTKVIRDKKYTTHSGLGFVGAPLAGARL